MGRVAIPRMCSFNIETKLCPVKGISCKQCTTTVTPEERTTRGDLVRFHPNSYRQADMLPL